MDFELLPNEDEAREGRASESTQRVLDALLPNLAKERVPDAYPLSLLSEQSWRAPNFIMTGLTSTRPGIRFTRFICATECGNWLRRNSQR